MKKYSIVFDNMFNCRGIEKPLDKQTCETGQSSSLPKIFDCLETSNFL